MRKSCVSVLFLALLATAVPLFAQTGNESRPYNVRIVFIGLTTFDMGDSYKSGDPITVIVPNLTKGTFLGDGTPLIPKHVSYLLADRQALLASHPMNQYHDFVETPHPSDNFIYLPFNGFHISVDDENDVAALNVNLAVHQESKCEKCPEDPKLDPSKPNPSDSNDENWNGRMCWLTSMEQVKGSKQVRDDAHFARQAPPLTRDEVAGRMVLRYGNLRAYVVGFRGPSTRNEAPIFDFKRSDGTTISQALAQETHWTFTARGIPFVLNLENINPGGPNERVAFIPTFPDNDVQHPGVLTIIVGNTMPEDVGPLEGTVTPAHDAHYAAYYRFIKDSDGTGPLPTPEMDPDHPDKFVWCTNNIHEPILQTLLDAQVMRGTARTSTTAKRASWALTKKKKPSESKAKVANAKDVPNDPMDMGDPAPGGLNCSGIRWR